MAAMQPPTYVAKADAGEVSVLCENDQDKEFLSNLGFSESESMGGLLVRKVSDDATKANVFSKLRDHGIPFSGGKEWNPVEVFEYLRGKRLLGGSFKEIWWTEPNHWEIRENNIGS